MVWHGHVGNEVTQQKVRKLDRRKKGQKGMAARAKIVGESKRAVVTSEQQVCVQRSRKRNIKWTFTELCGKIIDRRKKIIKLKENMAE
ncbi:hypothetical protein RUM44_011552, partial [Polyplax serrata]